MAVIDGNAHSICVGDSAVWLIREHDVVDLADPVPPKPLVGAGCFAHEIVPARIGQSTLLVASDGLVKYAPRERIAAIARGPDLEAAAAALIELVRLPTGTLPDDTTVVLCRGT